MEEGREWVERGVAGCPASAAPPDAAPGVCHRVALAGDLRTRPWLLCHALDGASDWRMPAARPARCTVQVSPHHVPWCSAPFITQATIYPRFRIQRAMFVLMVDA